jgi:glyoxylase-like metal-dependent hydrolase (beta-lactamase superfamily II)
MKTWGFNKGLYDLGTGCYAWIQPDGTWGYSNSGLIADSGESLLVDTLYDLPKTQEMLDGYRKVVPAAQNIGTLVNTHSNGDHYFGNQLVHAPRIVASRACAEEMAQRPPSHRAQQLRDWRELGDAGVFFHENLGGKFDLENIELVVPNEVFEKTLTLQVGNKTVELHNVGPAHTGGDTLAWLPKEKVVYTGDIIFADAHPIVWDGPVSNWIKACDQMIAWGAEIVVPGHGPICDLDAVRATKHYFEYLSLAARKRFDAGMSADEAVADINFDEFRGWLDPERVVVNVHCLYHEFQGIHAAPDFMEMSAKMLHYRNKLKAANVYPHSACHHGHEHCDGQH